MLSQLIEKPAQEDFTSIFTLEHYDPTRLVNIHAVILPNEHGLAQLVFVPIQHQSLNLMILRLILSDRIFPYVHSPLKFRFRGHN